MRIGREGALPVLRDVHPNTSNRLRMLPSRTEIEGPSCQFCDTVVSWNWHTIRVAGNRQAVMQPRILWENRGGNS
jgi:hypothetical protein